MRIRGVRLISAWLLVRIAAAGPVAALEPELEPANVLEREAREKLHDSVVTGLEAGGISGPSAGDVRSKTAKSKRGACSGATCAGQFATMLGVDRVVVTSVQVTGKNYDVQCQLVGADGAVLAKAAGSCDICTFAEALEATAKVASDLARRAPAPAPPVVAPVPVETKPAPANPPAERPRPAPAVVSDSSAAPVETPFRAAEIEISTEGAKERPYLWWAVGSWVTGVLGLAVGGYLVSLHGDPACVCEGQDCDGFDPERDCAEVFNTGGAGATLMGFGAAAVTGGFLLYFRERPGEGEIGAGFTPSARGAVASGWWHF